MPFELVPLYNTLLGLRELVFRSATHADLFDLEGPGLFPSYAARAVYQCWFDGELPLWAASPDGGLEQVAWRRGRSIDWPDTTSDVAITEYRGGGLLSLEKEPSLYRREGLVTSAAGAERLRAFVQAEWPECVSDEALKEWITAQGAVSEKELTARLQNNPQLAGRVSRSQIRRVHPDVKDGNKSLRPPRGPRPKK